VFKHIFKQWLLSRVRKSDSFAGSAFYWRNRYAAGGTSGPGSYGHLAEFKAQVLNEFVRENGVRSVIEFGFGDGSQLSLAAYPSYVGFEVSSDAIRLCRARFKGDRSKIFKHLDEYGGETADLCLSLDVIYHLIEDHVFESHMERLFTSAKKYVAIYSSDTERQMPRQAPHVRHRKFSRWVAVKAADWSLIRHYRNPWPYEGDFTRGSLADLYIYAIVP